MLTGSLLTSPPPHASPALQPKEGEMSGMSGHVIICGFGRVGELIGEVGPRASAIAPPAFIQELLCTPAAQGEPSGAGQSQRWPPAPPGAP